MCLPQLFAESLWEQPCPQPCNWALTGQTWLVVGAVRSCEPEPPSLAQTWCDLASASVQLYPVSWEGREGEPVPAALSFCWRTSHLPMRKAV